MTSLDFSYLNRPPVDVVGGILQGLQIRAERERLQNASQDRQRQATLRELQGQVLAAATPQERDTALHQLQLVAPAESLDLEKGVADRRATQMELQGRERQQELGLINRLDSALMRVAATPQLYASTRNQILNSPEVPDEIKQLLPQGFNTDEEFNAFTTDMRTRLQAQRSLLADPSGYQAQSREGKVIQDEVYLPGARDLFESNIRTKAGQPDIPAPPGLRIIAGQRPTAVTTRDAARIAGSVNTVLSTTQRLKDYVFGVSPAEAKKRGIKPSGGVGAELLPTDAAKRAIVISSLLQLQLKDAFELGALDSGSAAYLAKLIPNDPTTMRQDVIRGSVDEIQRALTATRAEKLRPLGFEVDDQAAASSSSAGGALLTPESRKDLVKVLVDKGLSDEEILNTLKLVGGQ